MIYVVLAVIGLCAGSFVNAYVWRVYEQAKRAKKTKKTVIPTEVEGSRGKSKRDLSIALRSSRDDRLSILHGRSMCPNCRHELAAKDLIPVLSWLSLKGKCRYCHKPIAWQYPLVELATAALFVASRFYWPYALQPQATSIWPNVVFGFWVILLVGFMALLVYDLRWMLLPNRIVYPFSVLAVLQAIIRVVSSHHPAHALLDEVLAVVVGGGIFYAIFQLSAGKWIGGGDVKLGWLLGLVLASPARAALMIFVAALLGTLLSLPLLMNKRLKRNSVIPFGPFLIIATIIVQLFGNVFLAWYHREFLTF